MTNPDRYFREETTAKANACAHSGGKNGSSRSRHGRKFTYTVERLQGGCLLYQLAFCGDEDESSFREREGQGFEVQ
jgi:hypothetical protein